MDGVQCRPRGMGDSLLPDPVTHAKQHDVSTGTACLEVRWQRDP